MKTINHTQRLAVLGIMGLALMGPVAQAQEPSMTMPLVMPILNVSDSTFTFTNGSQYSKCIEDILQLYRRPAAFTTQPRANDCLPEVFQTYERTGLSKENALSLIKAADGYASRQLSGSLFPLYGQRERIAIWFGYTYSLDAQNRAIQSLALGANTPTP